MCSLKERSSAVNCVRILKKFQIDVILFTRGKISKDEEKRKEDLLLVTSVKRARERVVLPFTWNTFIASFLPSCIPGTNQNESQPNIGKRKEKKVPLSPKVRWNQRLLLADVGRRHGEGAGRERVGARGGGGLGFGIRVLN